MLRGSEINHHLPEEVLAAYAAGILPEAYSLVVACHVSMCDTCRAALAAYEAVGGAVLEQAAVTDVSADSLARTMALIEAGAPAPVAAPKPAKPSVFPEPLQQYVGAEPEGVGWRSLGGGVRHKLIMKDGGGSARLFYFPGGCRVPDHSHRGLELTLVLQGAFSDSVARFARGDVEAGDSDLTHMPVAERGEACICLAATDAPLKFTDLVPRLAQWFLRM